MWNKGQDMQSWMRNFHIANVVSNVEFPYSNVKINEGLFSSHNGNHYDNTKDSHKKSEIIKTIKLLVWIHKWQPITSLKSAYLKMVYIWSHC